MVLVAKCYIWSLVAVTCTLGCALAQSPIQAGRQFQTLRSMHAFACGCIRTCSMRADLLTPVHLPWY